MLPSAFLSLGWTTGTNESSLEFTQQQVNDMLYYADRYYLKPIEMVTLEVEVHSIIRKYLYDTILSIFYINSAGRFLEVDARNYWRSKPRVVTI